MNILKQYNENIVKYDLTNKFNYSSTKKLPQLKFITLSFKVKNVDFKSLITALSALKLVTFNHGIILKSNVSNVSFKIRKGQPIGCKITLRKKNMDRFLFFFINKNLIDYQFPKTRTVNLFSLKINNILIFDILEQNYQYFKNVSDLNLDITTTQCTLAEFMFLIKSYKLST